MTASGDLILDPVFRKTLLLSACLVTAFAGSAPIGIITASGHFTLEQSQVWGNSTLFDGSAVETDAASSEMVLRNGVKIQLGAGSRAKVWENRIVLEKGIGQVTAPESYGVLVAGLEIRGSEPGARLQVGVKDGVEVTALNGAARVSSGQGVLMAAIPAGHRMNFAMQAAAAGTITRAGCLLYKENHFILQDEATQEVVEVNGQDFALNVGNRVEVTGTPGTAKPVVTLATSVLNVATVAPRSRGGCISAAAALGASTEVNTGGATPAPPPTATPKPPKTGMSTGAKIAIVGAIAGGGAGA